MADIDLTVLLSSGLPVNTLQISKYNIMLRSHEGGSEVHINCSPTHV